MNKAVIGMMGTPAASVVILGAVSAAAPAPASAAAAGPGSIAPAAAGPADSAGAALAPAVSAGPASCTASSRRTAQCQASVSLSTFSLLTAGVQVAPANGRPTVSATASIGGLTATAHSTLPAVSVASASAAGHRSSGKQYGERSGSRSSGRSPGVFQHGSGSGTTRRASAPGALATGSAGAPPGVPGWFLPLTNGKPLGREGNVAPQLPAVQPAVQPHGKQLPAVPAANPLSPQVVGTQLLGLAALWAAVGTVLATLRRRRPKA